MGVSQNTAQRAFHDLQAKGFIVVKQSTRLGSAGKGKSTAYEITELGLPGRNDVHGSKLYRKWENGRDFRICKSMANNPSGRNGKTKPCHQYKDGPWSK
jgi:hypothetical protein